MEHNTEYRCVQEDTCASLEDAVNALLDEGWVPLGGMSVAVLHTESMNDRKGYMDSTTEWVYAQAMTRTPAQAKIAAALRSMY